ncbi:HBL/NHE enterotoxin family protein [Paraburkholderia nemoris]|uniref:HBL/NHE enterotoxin family protein n=1 Tax=Paraburkholderia nemoris TaxID=2793076 RepID=UPI001B20BB1D|nr:HBL/NHE enterotoxin family protein [Paraburkholderia nemoris]CAE6837141.1 hypothetical protein LMG22931_07084 [Paraburkholderia nemoris]
MKSRKWKSFADQGADPKGDMTAGMGSGLIIQGYCLAVTKEPSFDFSADPNLQDLQYQCNSAMNDAVNNANDYINTMQPDCMTILDAMLRFIRLQNARIQSYKNGDTTKEDLAKQLQEIANLRQDYQGSTNELITNFNNLRPKIGNNSGEFKDLAAKVNATVIGDGEAVAALQNQIADVDKKIKALTAGSVLDALGLPGDSCLIAIGAASDVFTGGAATGAVVTGVAIAGTGVSASSAVGLAAELKAKNILLAHINQYKAEAAQTNAVASHLALLNTHAEDAVQALQKVAACWKTVRDSLGDLVEELSEDLQESDLDSLIDDYTADITDVRIRVQNIQDQFAGCSQPTDKSRSVDTLLSDWIDQAA